MENDYLPAIEKLVYHKAHVHMLSKDHIVSMRNEYQRNHPGTIFCDSDYSEALKASFDMEAQHEHFGHSRNLSIEGRAIVSHSTEDINEYAAGNKQLTDVKEPQMHFHSHLADSSKQNAATTHTHMSAVIKILENEGKIKKNKTIWLDNTDGCSKQYRCGTALYLLSVLAYVHRIIINRMINAPGHGKGMIDGLNAVDKQFIRRKMCFIGSAEASNQED